MSFAPFRRRAGRLAALLWLGLSALAAAPQAGAQIALPAPGAGVAAGVRVQLFVDQRRVATAKKRIGGEGEFPGYSYRMLPTPQGLQIRPDHDELLQRWKGNFPLGHRVQAGFESETQFTPVLLVLDVTNETGAPVQVASSYLEVEHSLSDRQPFIELPVWERMPFGGEYFDLRNLGWGRAENAQLRFAFGRDRPATETFTLALGSLGAVEVSPLRALAAVVPAAPALQRQSPKCRSVAQVRQCLAQLERQAPLGRLGQIATLHENLVTTRVIGTLSYQWRDARNVVQQREHPIDVEVLIFKFDTGESAELGAPSPGESGFKTIRLPLDRSQYRLALPYRPRLAANQNHRMELTLDAARASQHRFRVVMEMTDGSRAASAPFDLLYFVPNMDPGETRQVR